MNFAVTQETLRFYPAEALTERVAIHDTVIPLTAGLTTTTGEQWASVPVKKGTHITIATGSYHRSVYCRALTSCPHN